jgi:hypothetical protein
MVYTNYTISSVGVLPKMFDRAVQYLLLQIPEASELMLLANCPWVPFSGDGSPGDHRHFATLAPAVLS